MTNVRESGDGERTNQVEREWGAHATIILDVLNMFIYLTTINDTPQTYIIERRKFEKLRLPTVYIFTACRTP